MRKNSEKSPLTLTMVPNSRNVSNPQTLVSAPTAQRTSIKPPEPVFWSINDGFVKIPEPMISPTKQKKRGFSNKFIRSFFYLTIHCRATEETNMPCQLLICKRSAEFEHGRERGYDDPTYLPLPKGKDFAPLSCLASFHKEKEEKETWWVLFMFLVVQPEAY